MDDDQNAGNSSVSLDILVKRSASQSPPREVSHVEDSGITKAETAFPPGVIEEGNTGRGDRRRYARGPRGGGDVANPPHNFNFARERGRPRHPRNRGHYANEFRERSPIDVGRRGGMYADREQHNAVDRWGLPPRGRHGESGNVDEGRGNTLPPYRNDPRPTDTGYRRSSANASFMVSDRSARYYRDSAQFMRGGERARFSGRGEMSFAPSHVAVNRSYRRYGGRGRHFLPPASPPIGGLERRSGDYLGHREEDMMYSSVPRSSLPPHFSNMRESGVSRSAPFAMAPPSGVLRNVGEVPTIGSGYDAPEWAIEPSGAMFPPAMSASVVLPPTVPASASDSLQTVSAVYNMRLGETGNEKESAYLALPPGPLNRSMVLPLLLKMGSSNFSSSALVQLAKSFTQCQETDVEVICSTLIECVASLLPKSAVFAGLVTLWTFPSPKDSGATKNDVAEQAEANGTENDAQEFSASVSSGSGSALATASVRLAIEVFDSYLSTGRLMEARNVLCFLFELVYFNVVSQESVLSLVIELVQLVIEIGSSEGAQGDADYLLKLLLLGSLPWYPQNTAAIEETRMLPCLERIGELIEQSRHRGGKAMLLRESSWVLPYLNSLILGAVGCKTLPRVFSFAALPAVRASKDYFIKSLPSLNATAADVHAALENQRIIAAFHTYGGVALDQDVSPGAGAFGEVSEPLWDEQAIKDYLNGVRPLEPLDRWVLRQLFDSIIHAFRHTHELCADALLRLPVVHDQFELELIDYVFSEMLRQPRNLTTPSLFYFRLLQSLVSKQNTLVRLVHETFHRLVMRTCSWDLSALEIASRFFAFWFSGGSGVSDVWALFDFSRWTPEAVRLNWANTWARFGHKLLCVADFLENHGSSDALIEDQLPKALCHFLNDSLWRLSQLIVPDALRVRLPPSLQNFVPRTPMASASNCDVDALQASGNEPVEYHLFRRVLLYRFDSDAHRQEHLNRLEAFLRHHLLDKPPLSMLPSEAVIDFLRFNDALHKKPLGQAALTTEVSKEQPAVVKPECQHQIEENKVFVKQEEPSMLDAEEQDDVTFVSVSEKAPVDPLLTLKAQDDVDAITELVLSPQEAVEKALQTEPLVYQDMQPNTPWTFLGLVGILCRVLFDHGGKSLTHTNRSITNYHSLLANLQNSLLELDNGSVDTCKSGENVLTGFAEMLLDVIFNSKNLCFARRRPYVLKLFMRYGLLSSEVIQNYMFERLPLDQLYGLPNRDVLAWLVECATLSVVQRVLGYKSPTALSGVSLELGRNSATSIVNGPSDGDDSMFLLAQQKQFCAFVSQHLLCALRRVTDEGIVAPDDVYELPSSASSHNNEDDIANVLLFAALPLRDLYYFSHRFLYFIDLDGLQESLDVTLAQSAVTVQLIRHLRELQHYFCPAGAFAALSRYFFTLFQTQLKFEGEFDTARDAPAAAHDDSTLTDANALIKEQDVVMEDDSVLENSAVLSAMTPL